MDEATWFVPLSDPATALAHVYAIPHAGGGCATFAALADLLAPDTTVWGLNLPGRQARFLEPPRTELDPLLDELAADLAGRGRPVLLGYCSGALLAMLLARRLRRHGAQPAALIALSYPAPHRAAPPRTLHTMDSTGFWRVVLSQGGVAPAVAAQPGFQEIFEPALRADYALLSGYRHTVEAPLDAPIVTIFGDTNPVLRPADIEGWRVHTTAAFAAVEVPGGHWLLDGELDPLAEAVRRAVVPR